MKDVKAIRKLCDEEMMASISSKTQKKVVEKIVAFLNESSGKTIKIPKTEKIVGTNEGKNASKTKSKK